MSWRIAEAAVLVAGLIVLVRPAWVRFRQVLHLFQLDSYHPVRLLRLLGRRPWLTVAPELAVGAAALSLGFLTDRAAFALPGSLGWLVLVAAFAVRQRHPPEKKPLVFTGRAVRLVAVALALAAGASLVAGLAAGGPLLDRGRSLALWLTLSVLAAPLWLLLANALLLPYQWGLNRYFVARARAKLRRVDPLVVGITGSYGKTSTKSFLETLLSRKFSVLATPKSYNTLLGVSRTINESLRFRHQVFLVEMGAYGVGEIRATARLARPTVGVVVTVGLQHLERFGSREAIERAKGELVEELPPDGAAVLNRDDESGPRLAARSGAGTVLWFGWVDGGGSKADHGVDLGARAVEQTRGGIRFELVDREGGTAEVRTRLLGLHNVTNLLAAATVGLHLGLSLEELAAGLRRARPVPHRLELRRGVGGSTVIDNSYSSNPVSAHSSLEVLAELEARRRILVTPGIVELGAEIEPENRRFGAAAAGVCDHIVLVGEDVARMVHAGVEEAGYDGDRVHRVARVAEVGPLLERLGVGGEDVVLFENDLPDLYR